MIGLMRYLGAMAGYLIALLTGTAVVDDGGGGASDDDQGRTKVAILVVDDFEKPEESATNAGGNCTAAADGQVFAAGGAVFAAGGAAATLVKLTEAVGESLRHGDLVWEKFVDLLSAAAVNDRQMVAEPVCGKREQVWAVEVADESADIHLVAVDTAGFDTDSIAGRISDCIKELKENDGVDRFVVNMSFAIIPCEELTVEEYLAMVDGELKELKEALQTKGFSETEVYEAVRLLARTRKFYVPLPAGQLDPGEKLSADDLRFLDPLSDDPLHKLINSPPEDVVVINVAATGNAGRPYPYAPAIWTNVLSVGSAGKRNEHHRYANDGEVIAYDVVEFAHKDGRSIPVHGSSFAAPEVSVRAALYLAAEGSATCPGGEKPTTPPLAYAVERGGPWDDLSLPEARSRFCANFPEWP